MLAENVFTSNFVHILIFFTGLRSTNVPVDYRCWSYVGKLEGKQEILLGDGSEDKTTTAHEVKLVFIISIYQC